MSLSEISNILWRERRLLELLAPLEEEHLVLTSGRTRGHAASGEVDAIIEEIKHVRLERAIGMADSSEALGLSDTPSSASSRVQCHHRGTESFGARPCCARCRSRSSRSRAHRAGCAR
jgi:hypothetical protein